MKPDIHPDYRLVVFQDTSAGASFLTRSTIETTETVEWEDGNEYPLAKVGISSASHPFLHRPDDHRGHRRTGGALRAPIRPAQALVQIDLTDATSRIHPRRLLGPKVV